MSKSSEQILAEARPSRKRRKAERIPRRAFSKGLALFLLGTGAVVASGGVFLWNREKDKVPSVEASISFIKNEVENQKNLPSLREYGERKTKIFIFHAYNIFSQVTGSAQSARAIIDNTSLVEAAYITALHQQDMSGVNLSEHPTASDPRDTNGKVYTADKKSGKLGVAVNLDAHLFHLDQIRTRTYDHFQVQQTVLGNLLDTVLHEPHHYEIPRQTLTTPIEYSFQTAVGTTHISYEEIWGLSISGTLETPPYTTMLSANFDEASIYLIHRDLLQPAVQSNFPTYSYSPPMRENALLYIQQVFQAIGINSPQAILELRRAPSGGRTLIEKLGAKLPAGTFGVENATERGIVFLGKSEAAVDGNDQKKMDELLGLLIN